MEGCVTPCPRQCVSTNVVATQIITVGVEEWRSTDWWNSICRNQPKSWIAPAQLNAIQLRSCCEDHNAQWFSPALRNSKWSPADETHLDDMHGSSTVPQTQIMVTHRGTVYQMKTFLASYHYLELKTSEATSCGVLKALRSQSVKVCAWFVYPLVQLGISNSVCTQSCCCFFVFFAPFSQMSRLGAP